MRQCKPNQWRTEIWFLFKPSAPSKPLNTKLFFFLFPPPDQPFQTHCPLKVVLLFGAQVKPLAKEHYFLGNWKESSHGPNHVFLSTLLFPCDGCANQQVFTKANFLTQPLSTLKVLHSPSFTHHLSLLSSYLQSCCLQNKMQMTSSSFMNAHWPPF